MYAIRADIETLHGEDLLLVLTDRDNTGAVDDEAVSMALGRAAAIIDSHIGKAHRLPLPVIPEILRGFAIDLAIYYLAGRADVATDGQQKRHDNAIAHLKLIGGGKAALPLDKDEDGKEETSPAVISTSGPERIFTRQTMRDL